MNLRAATRAKKSPIRTRAVSLPDRVYEAFKIDIIKGVHTPEDSLNETYLAELYSTSRSPVREAAARLAREGLLQYVPRKGYFVQRIGLIQLKKLFEYRIIIECTTAELAAQRAPDPELLLKLKRLAEFSYEPGDRTSHILFMESDTGFHLTIAQLSRNEHFTRAVKEIRAQVEWLLYAALEAGNYVPRLVIDHLEIYRAIQERDPQRARDLMHRHLSSAVVNIPQMM